MECCNTDYNLKKCKYTTRFEKGNSGRYEKFRIIEYSKLNDEDKEYLVNLLDFEIDKNGKSIKSMNKSIDFISCWRIKDKQGANYGAIESDEFQIGDYDSIIQRLSSYFIDINIILNYK